jgi:hypothetical protein
MHALSRGKMGGLLAWGRRLVKTVVIFDQLEGAGTSVSRAVQLGGLHAQRDNDADRLVSGSAERRALAAPRVVREGYQGATEAPTGRGVIKC